MCLAYMPIEATQDALAILNSGKPFIMIVQEDISDDSISLRTIFREPDIKFVDNLDGELDRFFNCWNSLKEKQLHP